MVVTGLNSNRFLAGNSIPVSVAPSSGSFSQGTTVTMSVIKLVTHPGDVQYILPPVTFYVSPTGIDFDIRPYIKGLLPDPYVPGTSIMDPTPNYQNFTITFQESASDSSQTFTGKTFVRGFRWERTGSSQTLGSSEVLSPTDRIPVWTGWPSSYSYMESNQIRTSPIVPSDLVRQMKEPTACDPLYLRFLNSLGGYSYWMFLSWERRTESDQVGTIVQPTFPGDKNLGYGTNVTITADTRAKREFFPILKALLVSPVVQAYDVNANRWDKIEPSNGAFTENNYEDLVEASFTFDSALNVDPRVIW